MNTVQKEDTPLVSVIVPVFKVEDYIQECMESVVAQTYQHLEVILVDDCGDDKSIAMAAEVLAGSSLPWKTLRHEHNRGLSAARNTGVKEASGQYLFFLDSDDYLSRHAIELLVNKATSCKADMVFGNIAYDTGGKISRGFWALRQAEEQPGPAPLLLHCTRAIYPMAWNRIIRTQFYRESGVSFIEGIFHEDEPWAFALIVRGPKVEMVRDITYYYRQRSGAITADKRGDYSKLHSVFVGFKAIAEEAIAHGVSTDVDFCTWFQSNIHNYMWRLQEGAATARQKNELLRRLFTEVPLADAVLKKGVLFRRMRALSLFLPYRIWVHLYLQLRNAKDKHRSKAYILWRWWLGALMGIFCLVAAESLAEQWYRERGTISPLWQSAFMLSCGVVCLWVSIHSKRRLLGQRKILPSCVSAFLISACIVCSLFGNVLMDIPTAPVDSQVGFSCVSAGLCCFVMWLLLSRMKRK